MTQLVSKLDSSECLVQLGIWKILYGELCTSRVLTVLIFDRFFCQRSPAAWNPRYIGQCCPTANGARIFTMVIFDSDLFGSVCPMYAMPERVTILMFAMSVDWYCSFLWWYLTVLIFDRDICHCLPAACHAGQTRKKTFFCELCNFGNADLAETLRKLQQIWNCNKTA